MVNEPEQCRGRSLCSPFAGPIRLTGEGGGCDTRLLRVKEPTAIFKARVGLEKWTGSKATANAQGRAPRFPWRVRNAKNSANKMAN